MSQTASAGSGWAGSATAAPTTGVIDRRMIDLRAFPGVVTVSRLINAADQVLTLSAQRNAAAALRLQQSHRQDFDAQESDWLISVDALDGDWTDAR